MPVRPLSLPVNRVIDVSVGSSGAWVGPGTRTGALGRRIAITRDDPDIAHELATRLKAQGHLAELVERPSGPAGMVVLTGGLRTDTPTRFHARMLAEIQPLIPQLEAGEIDLRMLQAPAGTDGQWCSGLGGLVRTLMREYPDHRSQVLSFSGLGSPTDAALDRASACLISAAAPEDVTIAADGSATVPIMETVAGLPGHGPNQSLVSASDVFVVTGGGQGITAACTIALAQRTGATMYLLGRSQPLPWPAELDPAMPESEIRMTLAKAALAEGQRPRPADIAARTRKLVAGRSIQKTLSAIETAGGRGAYFPVDLSDRAGVDACMGAIRQRGAPITGIIHGAGVLADQTVATMTAEHVARVFAPKVEGLSHLLASCGGPTLRHVALFSSAAARFGNRGQANYAMANETLNQVARALKSARPELNVRSFDWGPWDGGMVSDSLKAAFAARGIDAIPLAEGAAVFAELMDGDPGAVEVCIGAV
ncbi:MAG: SDR family NAD(P)-dependent oxidoreductase [Pseudomonadota bacterium]